MPAPVILAALDLAEPSRFRSRGALYARSCITTERTICRRSKRISKEIWQELAKAKYLEWDHESSRRTWELKKLKEASESALKEKHELDSSQMEGFIDNRSTSVLKQLDALGRVFRKVAEDDTPTEVPSPVLVDPLI